MLASVGVISYSLPWNAFCASMHSRSNNDGGADTPGADTAYGVNLNGFTLPQ